MRPSLDLKGDCMSKDEKLEDLSTKLERLEKKYLPQGALDTGAGMSIATIIDSVGNLHGLLDSNELDAISIEEKKEVSDMLQTENASSVLKAMDAKCINAFSSAPKVVIEQVKQLVGEVAELRTSVISDLLNVLDNDAPSIGAQK